MAQFMRGIKAGLLAGIISGLIFGVILTLLNVALFYETIVQATDQAISQIPKEFLAEIDTPPRREDGIAILLYGPLFNLPFNVLTGIIVGLLFAVLFFRIPGKTAIRKGMFVGLFFWIISTPLDLFGFGIPYLNDTYFILGFSLRFVSKLLFGFLLGKFWTKFEK